MAKKRANGEGNLTQRKDGLWEQRIMIGYDSEGKRLRKSFYGKTQKEVRDKVAEFKRQQQMGLTTDADILFKDWAQQWYEGYKNAVSPTTYEGYKYTLKLLIDSLGRKKLRTIKPLDVENFFKELKEKGKSDSYITKCRGMLYQILHKAEANDLIIKNPVRFAEKTRKTQEAKPKEVFTKDEVKTLMDKLPSNRIGHTIRLMLATGLRGQEMVALQPEHIAEDGSMLYVRQAVKMVKGTAVIGNTKSSDGVRDVPVPSNARSSALYLRQQAGDFVWESRVKGKPMNMRNFRLLFTNALKELDGVRSELTPHCCRHTYVTNLQSLGVDAETIRSIVGHADIDMTAHYIHVQEETKRAAAQKLGQLFTDDAPPADNVVKVQFGAAV